MNEFLTPNSIPWVLTVLGSLGFLFLAFQALGLLKK